MSTVQSAAVQSMYSILSGLRIYALGQGGLVDAELAAYDAVFSEVEQALRSLEQSAFVATASSQQLTQHEALVGLRSAGQRPLDIRRKMITRRLSVLPCWQNMIQYLMDAESTGVYIEIDEQYASEVVQVKIFDYVDPYVDIERVTNRLDQFLPAHLHWDFDYGVFTWDMMEYQIDSWDLWDKKDFIWNDFDLYGQDIFGVKSE